MKGFCGELLQGLAGEKRRLQSGVAQLERELVAREGQLSGQAGELAALQEAQRDAHAQMNQYVMDLQVNESHHIVMSCCMVLCCVVSCHVMSCHAISCHVSQCDN